MGEYSADELGFLQRLMPHLKAGFALHRRLSRLPALAQAATGALQQIPFGVVVLDYRGHILFVNDRAENVTRLQTAALAGWPACAVHPIRRWCEATKTGRGLTEQRFSFFRTARPRPTKCRRTTRTGTNISPFSRVSPRPAAVRSAYAGSGSAPTARRARESDPLANKSNLARKAP
jgi:PAS domain-containing protein